MNSYKIQQILINTIGLSTIKSIWETKGTHTAAKELARQTGLPVTPKMIRTIYRREHWKRELYDMRHPAFRWVLAHPQDIGKYRHIIFMVQGVTLKQFLRDIKHMVRKHDRIRPFGYDCRPHHPEWSDRLHGFGVYIRELDLAMRYLQLCRVSNPYKKTTRSNSYHLKHYMENYFDDSISNGTAILAALLLRIPIAIIPIKGALHPNVWIGAVW